MPATDYLRQQHELLTGLLDDAAKLVAPGKPVPDPAAALEVVGRLMRALRVHLAVEDKSMYPRLLDHPDAQVQSMARRYLEEMGGLSSAFAGWARRFAR